MIGKWNSRFIFFALLTVAVAVMGYYIHASYQETNSRMERLKTEGTVVQAEMVKLSTMTYTDMGAHSWGYIIPGIEHENEVDGATVATYTKAQAEEMNYLVEVCYIYDEEGNLFTFDKKYVDAFVPWPSTQSIFLWVIGGIMFLIAMYFVVRNVIVFVVLKKGEESIGSFVEAVRSKSGSKRYFKVKYVFVRDGEQVTVVTPAIYDSMQVDKIKNFGAFRVRYLGKFSYIDHKI
ncbi:MAG: hypothetical protein IKC35_01020 [Clostridia bacterium]|nr:hypothetical protein [Clostridia bacterium]